MNSFSADEDSPSPAEWVVMAVSVAVTVALFGFVVWHAATTPAAATPEATVTGTETTEDGRVAVTVEVYNPGATGLESVTVSVDCTDASIEFSHVPTDSRRTGTLVCSADADDPTASIRSWNKI